MEEQQKEDFLKQQIKQIKTELGEGDGSPEKKELLEKAQHKVWNGATQAVFKKEMAKLDNIYPQSPDYPIQINYLQTLGRFALERIHHRQPEPDPTPRDSQPGPLRHGEGEGAHPGISGSKSSERRTRRVRSSASTVLRELVRPVLARASPKP